MNKILHLLLLVATATPLFSQIYTDSLTRSSFHYTDDFHFIKSNDGTTIDSVNRISLPLNLDLSQIGLGDREKFQFVTSVYDPDDAILINYNQNNKLSEMNIRAIRKNYIVYYSRYHPSENIANYHASGIVTNKLRFQCKVGFYIIVTRSESENFISLALLEKTRLYTKFHTNYDIKLPDNK